MEIHLAINLQISCGTEKESAGGFFRRFGTHFESRPWATDFGGISAICHRGLSAGLCDGTQGEEFALT
jgi:hypothetical protein